LKEIGENIKKIVSFMKFMKTLANIAILILFICLKVLKNDFVSVTFDKNEEIVLTPKKVNWLRTELSHYSKCSSTSKLLSNSVLFVKSVHIIHNYNII